MEKSKITLRDSNRDKTPFIFYSIDFNSEKGNENLGFISDYVNMGTSVFEINLNNITEDKEKMTALLQFLSSSDFVNAINKITKDRGYSKPCEDQIQKIHSEIGVGDAMEFIQIRPDKDKKDSATFPVIKGMGFEDFKNMESLVNTTCLEIRKQKRMISKRIMEQNSMQ